MNHIPATLPRERADAMQCGEPPSAKPSRTPAKPRLRQKRGALLVIPSAREAEGRRLLEFRAALIEHVGGRPSAAQLAVIDRLVMLQRHLTHYDRRGLGPDFSDIGTRRYLAWSNSFIRTLQTLGLQPAAAAPAGPTLSDYLAAKGTTPDDR